VHAVARAELRAGWRGLAAMALLVGLAGGLVLATAAVSERTRTAYPRLVQTVGLDDARLLVPADRPGLAAVIPRLPGVEQAWFADGWVAQVDGPELRYISVGAGLDQPRDLVRPVVVEGRAPSEDAADELLLGEPLAENLGVGVGAELTLRLLTAEEIGMFDVGFGMPDGAVARMRVVGIGRMPAWGDGLANALASPAFARLHGDTGGALTAHVRLVDRDQTTRDAFAAGLAEADAADPAVSVITDYVPPGASYPTAETDPAVRTAEQVLVAGLAVFGVVVALGGLLVAGQGLVRHHAARREAQWIERALGLTPAERVAARVLVGVLAGVVGAAVAVAAGRLEPLGSQARFEPEPGFRPSWAIALGGGAGLAVLFVLLTAGAAALAGTHRRRRARPVPQAAWGGRRPALVLGVRMAWSGRGGVPAVATVIGTGIAVAGIVATATFGAGLTRLVTTPERYGEPADLTLIDARPADVAALVADDRVTDLDLLRSAPVQFVADPSAVDAIAIERLKSALPVETVSGRAPTAPGEIAVGPRTAERLGLGEGMQVAVQGEHGPVTLTVTGLVVVRTEERTPLGDTALVVPEQLPPLALTNPIADAAVRAAPGHAEALFGELSQRLEVFLPERPDEVRNLDDLRLLPELLAGVLALAATAGLAHALLTAGRRHAHDLAVLAVLGATPGQVRGAVAVMGVATVLPALLVGVPLGLAGGRVLWWHVATATGVAGDVALPGPLLAAIVPVALLVALALAAGPALRVTRTPPAALLSSE
jgi:putative ABC transport system permease protein